MEWPHRGKPVDVSSQACQVEPPVSLLQRGLRRWVTSPVLGDVVHTFGWYLERPVLAPKS